MQPKEKFKHLIIGGMGRNQEVVSKLLNEGDGRELATELMSRRIYDELPETG